MANITITPAKRFDFSQHENFLQELSNVLKSDIVNINFMHVEYIDSSALGMLLIAKERAKKVNLINVKRNELTYDILKVASFEKIFEIT